MLPQLIIIATVWVCTARSLTGEAYFGEGSDRAEAQENAILACQNDSFRCYPTECHEKPHPEGEKE